MTSFRKIFLGIALFLTLIGNFIPVGVCFVDGTVSIGGNTCKRQVCAEHLPQKFCQCGNAEHESLPHEQLVIELDDEIMPTNAFFPLPELNVLAFFDFFKHFSDNIFNATGKTPTESPPSSKEFYPKRTPNAGILPLLA